MARSTTTQAERRRAGRAIRKQRRIYRETITHALDIAAFVDRVRAALNFVASAHATFMRNWYEVSAGAFRAIWDATFGGLARSGATPSRRHEEPVNG